MFEKLFELAKDNIAISASFFIAVVSLVLFGIAAKDTNKIKRDNEAIAKKTRKQIDETLRRQKRR